MKINIEINDELNEDEIIIRCRELTDEVQQIQRSIKEASTSSQRYVFYKGETQYYLTLDHILFFESDENHLNVHTEDDVYQTKYKLYEMEELLPSYFLRVSKSTILNTKKIFSISKNLTGASPVEFQNSHKKVYVSRSYYKFLCNKLEENRIER